MQPLKRGLTHQEAIEYVGVKRRTFDQQWRPHLVSMRQGACTVYDRQDLDRLFDQFKQAAAGPETPVAANDTDPTLAGVQNGSRNERPAKSKGVAPWAKQPGGYTPNQTDFGKSTNGSTALDFESTASRVLMKRNGG